MTFENIFEYRKDTPRSRLERFFCERKNLISIALRINKNFHEAEDVAQEVFTSLLSNYGGIPEKVPDHNIRAYISRMAVLIACCKVRRRVIETYNLSNDIIDTFSSKQEGILDRLEMDEIIGSVREPSATFLRLNTLEEKSYKEIALENGMSYRELKNLLDDERERIKRIYRDN